MKFLTDEKIDLSYLVSILKNNEKKYLEEDSKILEAILFNFEKNNLELLTPQEIHFLNNNSEKVWSDYLIFRYKFKVYPKQKIVSSFPIYLLIEPVSSCNLRCIMCFQIDDTFNSNKEFMGHMDLKLFKKIIDEAESNGTKAITLASRGEPTLHPKLDEMLEFCKIQIPFRLYDKAIEKYNSGELKESVELLLKINYGSDLFLKEKIDTRLHIIANKLLSNFWLIKDDYPIEYQITYIEEIKQISNNIDMKANSKLSTVYFKKGDGSDAIKCSSFPNPITNGLPFFAKTILFGSSSLITAIE